MKSTGCGSKQAVQDLNEAEDQDLRGEEELHQVTIETIKKESRCADSIHCGDPLIQGGLNSGQNEEVLMEKSHKRN